MSEIRCVGYDHRRRRKCNRYLLSYRLEGGTVELEIPCGKCGTLNKVALAPVVQSAGR